jgi:hypothetical protein
VAWLDRRGIVRSEWRKINRLIEEGGNLDAAFKRGEHDDDAY